MSENEVCEKLVAATIQSVAKAGEVLGNRFPVPELLFDLRGTTAGRAYTYLNADFMLPKIRYNMRLAKENLENFVNRTVPHEVSHIIANRHFGKNCGHGREWKWVMVNVFGVEPKRCHDYNVEGHRVRKTFIHVYTCGCGECKVGTKHHNIIQQSPERRIFCCACRQTINKENYITSRERH